MNHDDVIFTLEDDGEMKDGGGRPYSCTNQMNSLFDGVEFTVHWDAKNKCYHSTTGENVFDGYWLSGDWLKPVDTSKHSLAGMFRLIDTHTYEWRELFDMLKFHVIWDEESNAYRATGLGRVEGNEMFIFTLEPDWLEPVDADELTTLLNRAKSLLDEDDE